MRYEVQQHGEGWADLVGSDVLCDAIRKYDEERAKNHEGRLRLFDTLRGVVLLPKELTASIEAWSEPTIEQRLTTLEIEMELVNRQLGEIFSSGETKASAPTTPEELRTAILGGIDKILKLPFLGADNKRLLNAQKTYWQDTSVLNLSVLLTILQKEP